MLDRNNENEKHYNHTVEVLLDDGKIQRESLQVGRQTFHFSHDFIEKAKSYSESLNVRNLATMEATLDEINNEIQTALSGREAINKLIHDLQTEIFLIKNSMGDLIWHYNHELDLVSYDESSNHLSSYKKRTRILKNKLIQLRKKEVRTRHEKINSYQVDKAELLDWKIALKIYKRKHEVEIYELKQELGVMTDKLLENKSDEVLAKFNAGQIMEWADKYSQEEIERAYKMLKERNNENNL